MGDRDHDRHHVAEEEEGDSTYTPSNDDGHEENWETDSDQEATGFDQPLSDSLRTGSRRTSSGMTGHSRTDRDDEQWEVTTQVPGGPADSNDTVIPSFLGHIGWSIWQGNTRGVLRHANCQGLRELLIEWNNRLVQQNRKAGDMIAKTGMAHVPNAIFPNIDLGLICAFIERWQPDTNSFHLPFGEITILLHDVFHILRIPVEGEMVTEYPGFDLLKNDSAQFLGMTLEDFNKNCWKGGTVSCKKIIERCGDGTSDERQAIAWMWLMMEGLLLPSKCGDGIRPHCMHELTRSFSRLDSFSWGSATLAYLYRQMGISSRTHATGLSGCLTLLQAWIYEYFPCFRPHRERQPFEGLVPLASTWRPESFSSAKDRLAAVRPILDQLTADEVSWLPYGPNPHIGVNRTLYDGWIVYRDIIEPYMPGRCTRQLGYVQMIPRPIRRPVEAVRHPNPVTRKYKVEFPIIAAVDEWNNFPTGNILNLNVTRATEDDYAACHEQYVQWFYRVSHPHLLPEGPMRLGLPSKGSDYWIKKLLSITRGILDRHPDPEGSQQLEKLMEDWRAVQ